MTGTDNGLRWATLGALALTAVALLMNTCAMDRLEKQVIRQTRAMEGAFSGGAGPSAGARGAAASGPAGHAVVREPGKGTVVRLFFPAADGRASAVCRSVAG